ncbi:hypothetical protein GHK86_05060 [Acidimicrobiaceae bacterium USS-CC1]|uniref:Inositol monophosphatase n=1 Tax=Acidiferrimicrobium australe TaxID=2664430 RepID=A0ABW9QRW8_9ACTN|nr:hypothetical protein [Acidiferrimicrobium australe]
MEADPAGPPRPRHPAARLRPRGATTTSSATATPDRPASPSAGELITVADVEAERLLTRRSTDLPPAAVVGEEACAEDPTLLAGLRSALAWLVDPLDGTTSFVEDDPAWAVMVALCVQGRAVAAWIWQPTSPMYTAEAGGGAPPATV